MLVRAHTHTKSTNNQVQFTMVAPRMAHKINRNDDGLLRARGNPQITTKRRQSTVVNLLAIKDLTQDNSLLCERGRIGTRRIGKLWRKVLYFKFATIPLTVSACFFRMLDKVVNTLLFLSSAI